MLLQFDLIASGVKGRTFGRSMRKKRGGVSGFAMLPTMGGGPMPVAAPRGARINTD
jgi:hypothetical protein